MTKIHSKTFDVPEVAPELSSMFPWFYRRLVASIRENFKGNEDHYLTYTLKDEKLSVFANQRAVGDGALHALSESIKHIHQYYKKNPDDFTLDRVNSILENALEEGLKPYKRNLRQKGRRLKFGEQDIGIDLTNLTPSQKKHWQLLCNFVETNTPLVILDANAPNPEHRPIGCREKPERIHLSPTTALDALQLHFRAVSALIEDSSASIAAGKPLTRNGLRRSFQNIVADLSRTSPAHAEYSPLLQPVR